MFQSRNIVPCAKPFFCLFLWPTIIPRVPSIGGSRSTNQRIATVVSSKPQPCLAQVFSTVAIRWLMDLDRRTYFKCLWSRILQRSCRESWSCNFRIAFLEKVWKNWALTRRRRGDISYKWIGSWYFRGISRKEIKWFGVSSTLKGTRSYAGGQLLPALFPSLAPRSNIHLTKWRFQQHGAVKKKKKAWHRLS